MHTYLFTLLPLLLPVLAYDPRILPSNNGRIPLRPDNQNPRLDFSRLGTSSSQPTLGDPALWTPKALHCTTTNTSPQISDCLSALAAMPLRPDATNSDDDCYPPGKDWQNVLGKGGKPYKVKAVEQSVTGRSGRCGVTLYDPKGFVHCAVKSDVEEAVMRLMDGCGHPILGGVEGWTDIRHAPGGGRRVVMIRGLKEGELEGQGEEKKEHGEGHEEEKESEN